MIDYLLTAANVKVIRQSAALVQAGFDVYTTFRDKDWGLVDCISFVAMREYGVVDALTHDQHFVQAGFRALRRDDA